MSDQPVNPERQGAAALALYGLLTVTLACANENASPAVVDAGAPDGSSADGPDPSTTDTVLRDDEALTAGGVFVLVDVFTNDTGSGGALEVATPPKHGSATVVDGKLQYEPEKDFAGDDAFEYTQSGTGATATVRVTVLTDPGVVVLGQLYAAEISDEISWSGINDRGDRVGDYEQGADVGAAVFVSSTGERELITAPGPAADLLVRGLAPDGTVIANYLHETRYQFIGFTWKDGVHDRICDLGDGLGDCTPESMLADGTIVGTVYDYVLYTGFVWPADGDRMPLSLAGYASTYAYDITNDGTVVGVGDDSSDGYSGPGRCFSGKAGALKALPFDEGNPHFVSCRATNADGLIVGGVKPLADAAGVPRSQSDRMSAALWHPTLGFAYVPFPVERPSADAWRVELLLGLNDAGVMVGYFQDAVLVPGENGEEPSTERTTRGITLTPVVAPSGNSYPDSTFDHVNGPV